MNYLNYIHKYQEGTGEGGIKSLKSKLANRLKNTVKNKIKEKIFSTSDDEVIRKTLYDNLAPVDYPPTLGTSIVRLQDAMTGREPWNYDDTENEHNYTDRDDIFAEYLGIPKNLRHKNVNSDMPKVEESLYKPSMGGNNKIYYKLTGLSPEIIDDLVKKGTTLPLNKSKVTQVLSGYFSDHTISHGRDKNGEYISYYDLWDVNPFRGRYAGTSNITLPTITIKYPTIRRNPYDETDFDIDYDINHYYPYIPNPFSRLLEQDKDLSLGIGKPVPFYDRIYLDDYYNLPDDKRGYSYLPELIVSPHGKLNYLNYTK